jgi:hypothetical protein
MRQRVSPTAWPLIPKKIIAVGALLGEEEVVRDAAGHGADAAAGHGAEKLAHARLPPVGRQWAGSVPFLCG